MDENTKYTKEQQDKLVSELYWTIRRDMDKWTDARIVFLEEPEEECATKGPLMEVTGGDSYFAQYLNSEFDSD